MSISSIPKELQLQILSYISYSDLMSVSLTCHRLKDVSRDPALWRTLTLEYERIMNSTKACRDHVSRCTGLKEIVITTGGMVIVNSDKIVSVIMKAKGSLTSIDISSSLSNTSLNKISKMTQLRKLAFYAGKVNADGIDSLTSLTELRSLKLPEFGLNCPPTVENLNELANLFNHLKKLEEFEFHSGFLPSN